jgi:large subunit ribosomal protein L13
MKVLNAEGKVLGRFASEVAQHARDGEEVKVVNSEKAVISGSEKEVLEEYEQKYERGRRDRGPYYPKRADKILKRTIRNMLPDGPDGREERSQIRTYIGVPDRFEEEVEEVEVKSGSELKHRNYVKLGEVSDFIGGGQN